MFQRPEIKTLEGEYLSKLHELKRIGMPESFAKLEDHRLKMKTALMQAEIQYRDDQTFRINIERKRNFKQSYRDYFDEVSENYQRVLKFLMSECTFHIEYKKNYTDVLEDFFEEFRDIRAAAKKFYRDSLDSNVRIARSRGDTEFLKLHELQYEIYENYNKCFPYFIDERANDRDVFYYAFANYSVLKKNISKDFLDPFLNKYTAVAHKYHTDLEFRKKYHNGFFNYDKENTITCVNLHDKLGPESGRLESAFMNIKKELFADESFKSLANIRDSLGWLSIVFAVLLIPVYFYRAGHAALLSKDRIGTRLLNGSMALVGMAISVLAIVVAAGALAITAPILIAAGAAKTLAESLWHFGESIYERYFKKGKDIENKIHDIESYLIDKYKNPKGSVVNIEPDDKALFERLTELRNLKHGLNAKIFERAIGVAEASIAAVGAGLLFTPAAPVGVGLLLGVAVFAIANVISMYASKKPIYAHFFDYKKTDEVEDVTRDFTNRLGNEIRKKIELIYPIDKDIQIIHSSTYQYNKKGLHTDKPIQLEKDLAETKVADTKLDATVTVKPAPDRTKKDVISPTIIKKY